MDWTFPAIIGGVVGVVIVLKMNANKRKREQEEASYDRT